MKMRITNQPKTASRRKHEPTTDHLQKKPPERLGAFRGGIKDHSTTLDSTTRSHSVKDGPWNIREAPRKKKLSTENSWKRLIDPSRNGFRPFKQLRTANCTAKNSGHSKSSVEKARKKSLANKSTPVRRGDQTGVENRANWRGNCAEGITRSRVSQSFH